MKNYRWLDILFRVCVCCSARVKLGFIDFVYAPPTSHGSLLDCVGLMRKLAKRALLQIGKFQLTTMDYSNYEIVRKGHVVCHLSKLSYRYFVVKPTLIT